MPDIVKMIEQAEYRRMNLADITPAPYNPRVALTEDDPEYRRIKRSILDHGMIEPIIVNTRTSHAIGGNQRLQILKDLGVESAICAVVDMPLETEKEANIAVNKIGNLWDQAKLREVMKLLDADDYDLGRTGFSDDEIERFTQEMSVSVDSFFEQEGEESNRQKKTRKYRCPHCGEVFEK